MNVHTSPAQRTQRRFLKATATPTVDADSRTCELSFSSEARVPMPNGIEVLSHAPGAADLSRLNSSAPLLFNHDANDVLGVVVNAQIVGGKGRALVRFGRDTRGEWAMRQAADGVLVNVSFTYRVTAPYKEAANGDLVATRWEAIEISLVTVPADKTVGIGRSINTFRNPNIMDDDIEIQQRPTRSQRAFDTQESLRMQAQNATALERERANEIAAMGRRYGLPESQIRAMQQDGTSIEDARARTLEFMQSRQGTPTPAVDLSHNAEIGMSDSEVRGFSICRAISAMITQDWSGAGLERDASRAVSKRLGKQSQGFFVPLDVMRRSAWQQRAPYQVGTAIQGGNLVPTDLHDDMFIEALRNQSQVISAGATVLPGLVGNVDIPRRSGTTATYWVAESGGITEAEATFDKISLRPRTIGALSKMSRLMLMQASPAIEMLTRADMMLQLGLGIDLAALSGTGAANQPLGIMGTAGVGVLVGGTNGANVSLDTLIALETLLANSNAPVGKRGYLLNTKSIATLKTLKASTGQYLWTTDSPGQRSGTPPTFGGYGVYPSNQLRSTLTKGTSVGNCSELVFGAWDELIIGEWGVLEIVANPYDSTGFAAGDVLIRAMQTVDIAVRHAASFAVMSDALTP